MAAQQPTRSTPRQVKSDSGTFPGLTGAKTNTDKRQTMDLETRDKTMC